MIPIEESARERGDVIRKIITRDQDGDNIAETSQLIWGEHWLDLQPLSNQDRIANDTLGFKVTHSVFPQILPPSTVRRNDFYRINGRLYRIINDEDFGTLRYFDVWDELFGRPTVTPTVKRYYHLDSIPPGVYTFGSGLFSSVPAFSSVPCITGTKGADGASFISSITANGLTVTNQLYGNETPSVSVDIWETVSNEIGFWCKSGIANGVYTFGSGSFSDITGLTQTPFIKVQENNDSFTYVSNPSASGFTLVNRLLGSATPSCSVIVIDQSILLSGQYMISGLSNGIYTFGSGALSSVPAFVSTPKIIAQANSDRSFHITNRSKNGFTIVDGLDGGEAVSVTVLIMS